MTETNPYNAYTEDAILNSGGVGLVVALYEGAIESCIVARNCLASRDIPGRTKAINRIINILTELLRTLNDEKGGEISHNLRRLYVYIQGRVTEAHMHQQASPLEEVERLLSTLLEGWRGAKTSCNAVSSVSATSVVLPVYQATSAGHDAGYSPTATEYGYVPEIAEYATGSAYSF